MTQGRKPLLNPCERKGRYLDKHSGVVYKFKHTIYTKGCCECAVPMLDMAARDSTAKRYAIDPDVNGTPKTSGLICLNAAKRFSADAIEVVPCKEFYRARSSPGTLLHNKGHSKQLFPGCQAVEEDLYERKLVSLVTNERQTKAFLNHLLESGRGLFALQNGNVFLVSVSPEELALLNEMREEVSEVPKDFWRKLHLTKKQRLVVEDIFLYNQGETLREIATKYGISIDSLKDRIKGVKKKLNAIYPDLLRDKRLELNRFIGKKKKSKTGPEVEKSPDPMVFSIDPKTGVRTKITRDLVKQLKRIPKTPMPGLELLIAQLEAAHYIPTYNGTWSIDPAEDKRVGYTDREKRQELKRKFRTEEKDDEMAVGGRQQKLALDQHPVILGKVFEFPSFDPDDYS